MRKKREDLTPEVREQVVKDYLARDKCIVIQHEYKISPGEMYRILHRANVKLRETWPCHLESLRERLNQVAQVPSATRPKCRRCGRDYDPGLRKDGQPDRREIMCWICSGWATEYRAPREVYNQDGHKVMSKEDDPWRRGRSKEAKIDG